MNSKYYKIAKKWLEWDGFTSLTSYANVSGSLLQRFWKFIDSNFKKESLEKSCNCYINYCIKEYIKEKIYEEEQN